MKLFYSVISLPSFFSAILNMGTTQTATNEQRLSALFPGMNASTIQNTLNEANGDTAKAIVLLIQTPSNSESTVSKNPYKNHNEFLKNTKNKHIFIKQQFKGNTCNSFAYIISILFWIFIAIVLIVTIILSSTDFLVAKSFSFTLCFCSIIELIFALLILYGVLSCQIWSIWVTFLWSALHGITVIYLLVKWHNNSQYILYYISMVVIYWLSVIIFNTTYFIKLNRAESRFNSLIEETKSALNKKTNTSGLRMQKNNNNTQPQTSDIITSEIIHDSNTTLKTNKNDNNHEKQETTDIQIDELVGIAMNIFDDIDSDQEIEQSDNDNNSNDGSVIIKLDIE
eukprot:198402_1